MARYTETIVAALRQRYEDTGQTLHSIAAEFAIGTRSLQRLARERGWARRSDRVRGLPVAMQLLEQAKTLAATLPPRGGGEGPPASDDASRGGGPLVRQEEAPAPAPAPAPDPSPPRAAPVEAAETAANAPPSPSAIDRLEALVVKEIEIEEAARAQLFTQQRATASERNARTLATLAQTLALLKKMRAGQSPDYESFNDDDMPLDLDQFRLDLARRIRAFVASRTGTGDAGGPETAAEVDKVQ